MSILGHVGASWIRQGRVRIPAPHGTLYRHVLQLI